MSSRDQMLNESREVKIVDEARTRTRQTNVNWFFVKTARVHFPIFCPQTQLTLLSEYAQVLKMLGNGRVEAQCFDGSKRLAHIRGKMRKKVCFLYISNFFADPVAVGLDQSGRHHLAFSTRIPRRQSRRHRKIHSRRSTLPESLRRTS